MGGSARLHAGGTSARLLIFCLGTLRLPNCEKLWEAECFGTTSCRGGKFAPRRAGAKCFARRRWARKVCTTLCTYYMFCTTSCRRKVLNHVLRVLKCLRDHVQARKVLHDVVRVRQLLHNSTHEPKILDEHSARARYRRKVLHYIVYTRCSG